MNCSGSSEDLDFWQRVLALNVLQLIAKIYMAGRFNAQSKGWQTYSKPIGRLQTYGSKFGHYERERIKSLSEDDECIYYPTVYGKDNNLRIVSNPTYGLKDVKRKPTKADYDTAGEDIYEVLRCNASQPTPQPPLRQLGNRNPHTPVPRSVLRALNNDLVQNRGRVLTFEPSSCRRDFANNNYDVKKSPRRNTFVSPQYENSLSEHEDSEELLDYCTCMCVVKGAFYHLTKDSDSEGHLADQPCSCAGPVSKCLPRWGCLGIFALFFPCLWCYLPVKGLKKLSNVHNSSDSKPLQEKPGK